MNSVQFEIKLGSGRVLGPLDLKRVEQLARSQKLSGFEVARELPHGEWRDINTFPELGEILIRVAAGTRLLQREGVLDERTKPIESPHVLSGALPGATEILPGATQVLESAPDPAALLAPPEPEDGATEFVSRDDLPEGVDSRGADQERTQVQTRQTSVPVTRDDSDPAPVTEFVFTPETLDISAEKTLMFEGVRRSDAGSTVAGVTRRPQSRRERLKQLALAGVGLIALVLLGQEYAPELVNDLLGDPAPAPSAVEGPFRPQLPAAISPADPQKSAEYFKKAIPFYLQDQITGYRQAAEYFEKAIAHDTANVKAIAFLASTYLHLIDVSNKDENYFGVISKLIEQSRVKALDLPETVIADVEFFLTVNKPEAAEKRIVDFTKGQTDFDLALFYYLALAFYYRGDPATASRYLALIPDNKVFSAKVFHLKGMLAEKINDTTAALVAYGKAIQFNPKHAFSHLRRADLLFSQGVITQAADSLSYLVDNPRQLAARDLARAYYLHSQWLQTQNKWDLALADMERATRLEKENPDYLLELYTLRAKAGDTVQNLKLSARMYYFLGEGEKLRKQGQTQEALNRYLMARQADDTSFLPPLKIGDMFRAMGDVANAATNYRIAATRAPNNIEVWSKYIGVLIDTYEWEEAQKAMDRFRQLPVPQSSIDKAAADLYAKQGRHTEAQVFYRKAMSRETIDPGVYIAYGRSLMATQNYKDAPFFFALALRFDPLNVEATLETARAVAAGESADRAIQMLQDELNKAPGSRAEFLAVIAELMMKKGQWDLAYTNLRLAMEANVDYAYPWRLMALWILQQDTSRRVVDRALAAYKSYSDRNPSDAEGYLDSFKLLIRKLDYDGATDQLRKIYAVFPKYPNLHYFQGQLYEAQGNMPAAAEEYKLEIRNNPGSVPSMLALGKVLLSQNDSAGAVREFIRAMQLAPAAAEPKQLAGWANCQQKNYSAGIALLRGAAQIDRGNALIYKRLAVCYREAGDGASAKAAARKYLQMEPDAVDRAVFERF